MQRGSGRASLGAVLVARCALEGSLFAALFAVAQVALRGDRPIPIVAFALGLTGAGIILASVLRDARADRQNTVIAVSAIGAAAALGLAFRTPRPEGLEILTRLVLFGILGEAFVWRNLSVARGLVRWTDARNAGFAAIGGVVIAAVLPDTDRTGLLVVGLATTSALGVALSLARTAEELELAGTDPRGGSSRSTASGTAILLAIVSIVGAVFAPTVGESLASAGRTIAPVIGDLLFGGLLLLGYVAALVVELFRALINGRSLPRIQPPTPPVTPAEEAEAIRQIEAARPFVIGAVEVVVAVIALLLVVLLIERMARERRSALPEGATLDRETSAGEGLGAFLAGLLPRRRAHRRPPRDDGTPAGALRVLYWRYLAKGEASGVPWREMGETPAEHQERAEARAARFAVGSTLVRAFEDLRYGERDPDPATLDAMRASVSAIDTAR